MLMIKQETNEYVSDIQNFFCESESQQWRLSGRAVSIRAWGAGSRGFKSALRQHQEKRSCVSSLMNRIKGDHDEAVPQGHGYGSPPGQGYGQAT